MQTIIEQDYRNRGAFSETYRTERSVPNGERLFVHADELVDYAAIEAHAREILANHTSPEKRITIAEYENNARTAIFEALTSSGHSSRIEFEGDFHTVHQEVMTRLLNGYDYSLPQHELDRRFAEVCEELATYKVFCAVEYGEVPSDVQISTISDFAAPLGTLANKLGYRELNRKGMLRTTWLERDENGVYKRMLEQVSRSNSDATESLAFLRDEGVMVERRGEVDVDVLHAQLINFRRDATEGAVGLMRRLDSFAGPNIMYGEPKAPETISYENLNNVSAEREKRVEGFVKELALFEKKLDQEQKAGRITQHQWQGLYIKEVTNIVRSICVIDPSYVKSSLGIQVQEAYNKAHDQYLSGDTSSASDTIASVSGMENAVVICGSSNSEEQQVAQNSSANSQRTKRLLEASKKWEFTKGRCRVANCPTSGQQTEVGPCDVCRLCQGYYDQKKDPAKEYAERLRANALSEALALSNPAERVSSRQPKLIKIDDGIGIGGAEAIYRDPRTGAIGTKRDFGLA